MADIISREQAAHEAGVTVRTIDRMRKDGRLTTYRSGAGKVGIDRAELKKVLKDQETFRKDSE